jgi:hypothetical protein
MIAELEVPYPIVPVLRLLSLPIRPGHEPAVEEKLESYLKQELLVLLPALSWVALVHDEERKGSGSPGKPVSFRRTEFSLQKNAARVGKR